MINTPILERLSTHRTLSSLPQNELVWIAGHGELRQLGSGDVLTRKERQVDGLHIVLGGHMTIHVDRGAGRRKIMEWRGGDVTGLMPYSRLVSPPGDVIAEEPTEVFTLSRDKFPEMIQECHELTAILVHVMVDRARHFTSSYLQDEKLVSLGKLAAGLAHELNNPASAIARSAGALSANLVEADAAARALGSAGLTPEQINAADKIRNTCLKGGVRSVLSPLEAGRTRERNRRLARRSQCRPRRSRRNSGNGYYLRYAGTAGFIRKGPAFNAALRWVAAGCDTRRLTLEIQEASSRIYDLVAAIKGFTQMDRESVPEPVAIGQGLADTLVVLRAKAKSKSVGLSMNVPSDPPARQRIRGRAESGLGEPDRQCPGCRQRGRTCGIGRQS